MNEQQPDYKRATLKKYRFNSVKGKCSVEDLWDLPNSALIDIGSVLHVKVNESTGFDPLGTGSSKATLDDRNKLAIIVDVIDTRNKAQVAAKEAAEVAAKKRRIAELIEKKKDEGLANLSIEELEKLL